MLGKWGTASDRLGVRVKESRETWSRSTEKRRADRGAWGQAAGGALEGALEGLWLASLELGLSRPPRQDGRQAVAIVLDAGTNVGTGLMGARGDELPKAGVRHGDGGGTSILGHRSLTAGGRVQRSTKTRPSYRGLRTAAFDSHGSGSEKPQTKRPCLPQRL